MIQGVEPLFCVAPSDQRLQRGSLQADVSVG